MVEEMLLEDAQSGLKLFADVGPTNTPADTTYRFTAPRPLPQHLLPADTSDGDAAVKAFPHIAAALKPPP